MVVASTAPLSQPGRGLARKLGAKLAWAAAAQLHWEGALAASLALFLEPLCALEAGQQWERHSLGTMAGSLADERLVNLPQGSLPVCLLIAMAGQTGLQLAHSAMPAMSLLRFWLAQVQPGLSELCLARRPRPGGLAARLSRKLVCSALHGSSTATAFAVAMPASAAVAGSAPHPERAGAAQLQAERSTRTAA